MSRKVLLTIVTAPLMFFLGAFTASAAAAPGSLVKISSNSAVYLYGTDGYRHAFPSEKIFLSWFLDFSGVQEISATELAAMPLGHNVTYRPGSRLVKITTDPKVYAVLEDGRLRPIATESDALDLYGVDWAKRIDDVPDTFFVDYDISDELKSADGWPDDTVVRSSNGANYIIEDGMKRLLEGTAATNLGRFAVPDNGRLSVLSEGGSFVAEERPYSAPVTVYPDTPTFRAVNPANRYVASGEDVTLGEFRLLTAKAVTVNKLKLRVEALKDEDTDETDEDFGGLVYGNTIRANLTNLHAENDRGQVILGPNELVVDIARDELQTIYLLGNVQVPANSELVLKIRAKLNDRIPDNEPYRISLLKEGTEVTVNGSAINFLPDKDIVASAVLARTSDVMLATDIGGGRVVRGVESVGLASFKLTGGAVDTYLKRLTLTSYLDSENNGIFGMGYDADSGVEIRFNQIVPKISVVFGDKELVASADVGWGGQLLLTGLNELLPAGETVYVSVYGGIPRTAPVGSKPDKLAFDIKDVTNDLELVDKNGTRVNVQGDAPNFGTGIMQNYITVLENGTLHFEWSAAGGTVLAGNEITLGTLRIKATDDSYHVSDFAFWQTDGNFPPQTFPDVYIQYKDSSGVTITKSVATNTRQLSFTGLDIFVEKGKTSEVKLIAPSLPLSAGAKYTDKIGVAFDSGLLLQFSSDTSGVDYSQTILGDSEEDDFYADEGNVSVAEVRFGSLNVQPIGANSGSIYRDSDADTIRFSIEASGTTARIKNLTISVAPRDAGKAGSDNDALERWARLDPTNQDANSVGDLVRVYENSESIVGEGSDVTIDYYLYRTSRLPDPLVDSRFGDQAEIVYTWRQGSEYSISPGEKAEFVYRLDTTKLWESDNFQQNQDFPVMITLAQSPGFYWTDDPGINSTTRSSINTGLPISGTFTVLKP